jgi:hypothetical protein
MDSHTVEAIVLAADGSVSRTDGVLSNKDFAHWLLARVALHAESRETPARLEQGATA